MISAGIRASHLPQDISYERINQLPEAAGVYYFYNTYGNVIYIGKSINIRKRIHQHFGNIDSKTDKFGQFAEHFLLNQSKIGFLHPFRQVFLSS